MDLAVVLALVGYAVDHYSVYHFHCRTKQTRWGLSDLPSGALGIRQVRILVHLILLELGVEVDDVLLEVGGHAGHSEGVDIRLGGSIADRLGCLGSDIPLARHVG